MISQYTNFYNKRDKDCRREEINAKAQSVFEQFHDW
jgi:hypothetical protein